MYYEEPKRGNGLAIASLVTGICSVVLCSLGVLIGPVAVILGIVAGSRSKYDAKVIWGIVTGALGTILSVVAIVVAVITYSDQLEKEQNQYYGNEEPSDYTADADEDEPTDEPTEEPSSDELVFTEDGIAASGYETAYEAWLDTYGVVDTYDGLYAGGDLETPCYTMAGEAWWVTGGEDDTCDGESELWWEEYSGTEPREIKLFGSGAVGGSIAVDAVPAQMQAELFPEGTLDAAVAYVGDILLPESGLTDITSTPTTVGGTDAVMFEATSPNLENFRIYVLQSPAPYDEVGGVQFFLVHVYNEVGWVYDYDDTVDRFEETFAWK